MTTATDAVHVRITRHARGAAGAALAVLAALAAPARGEIHPRAVPVLERLLAATGGREAREAERVVRFKGRIEAAGFEGHWELWIAQPDRWYRRVVLGPLRYREGFDGRVAWRTDLTDKSVIVLSEALAQDAREEGWFLNERWALADHGGGTLRLGSTAYGTEVVHDVLEVTPPAGRPRRMFVDQRTGLIERVVSEHDHHTIEERLGEYRRLGGRKRATLLSAPTLLPRDKPVERMTVDSAWVNPRVDTTRFSPPAADDRAIRWTRAKGAARVPFDYTGQTVIVKVSINGAPPADFILDTGASLTVLDENYAYALDLIPEGDSYAEGIAAAGAMRFARVRSIALGDSGRAGATLRDFRVALLDLGRGDEVVLWRRTHGLLGADFLSRFVVEIDYDRHVVVLHDPQGFRYQGGGTGIPFELHEGIPVVDMTLDGGCSGKFLVDVGNAFQFVVHRSLVRSCRMIGGRHRREVEVFGGGIGGGFVSTLCRLDSLRIGPFSWTEPVAALSLHSRGMIGSKVLAGNIGNSMLERFHCTFDYARRTLYLEPGRRYGQRERVSRFGALFARLGVRVIAGNVLSGSAAFEAGLRWFDEIVAVDGKPLDRWTREEIDRVLEQGEAGSVHRITYRRFDDPDKTVEVTLKDVL